MARKKIVFVIVEGPTDEDALATLFTDMFDMNKVHIEIMHCDILTDYLNFHKQFTTIRNKNILIEIKNIVNNYAINNHFTSKDFQEIIHICDTDGCFVSDDLVIEDPSVNNIVYSTKNIRCKDKKSLLKYRDYKKNNIIKLINCNTIWTTISYKLYYMSSSINHVLYNKLNSSEEEKEQNAYEFYKKYKTNSKDCYNYLANSDFTVKKNYIDSWNFIMKDENSLKRHTNIHLCFKKVLENHNK